MATLSILGYTKPQSYKMKGTNENAKVTSEKGNNVNNTFNKITVQNVLSENNTNNLNISNNSANTIVRKIKDFGMFGTVNNAASKSTTKTIVSERKQSILETKSHSAKLSDLNCSKKSKINKDGGTPKSSKKYHKQCLSVEKAMVGSGGSTKSTGTPGRKGLPLPQAVARRNARERNRVKQVNNGFAALRQRIPEEVAEVFEAQGNSRSSAKKLSKVETLRMAVEYIRSLERLLGFDFPMSNAGGGYSICSGQGSSSGEDSFVLIKDEFDELSHGDDDNYEDSLSNYDMDDYFSSSNTNTSQDIKASNQTEVLPNITTLNGLKYIRIAGTNAYQLITDDIFAQDNSDDKTNAIVENICGTPVTTVSLADSKSTPEKFNNNIKTARSPATQTYGECFNITTVSLPTSTFLTHTPVPQIIPTVANTSLHEPQQKNSQSVTLAPVYNEELLRTCATNNLKHQPLFKTVNTIKKELNENTVDPQTRSPQSATYQTTPILQNDLSSHTMSPPLDRMCLPQITNAPGIHAFYEQDQSASFYEGVVAFKKEFNDGLLDTSAATAALSDESMIEAIDWWEAHTPKSEGGSVIL